MPALSDYRAKYEEECLVRQEVLSPEVGALWKTIGDSYQFLIEREQAGPNRQASIVAVGAGEE